MKKHLLHFSLAVAVALPATAVAQNSFPPSGPALAPQFTVAGTAEQFPFIYGGATNDIANYGLSVGPHVPSLGAPVVGLSGWGGIGFFTHFRNRAFIDVDGNFGIGTETPNHRLSISGGPRWTSHSWIGAMELDNGSAIGWRGNAAGNRFGIGQTDGGLYFFRSASDPGTTGSPASYLMKINDAGNVGIGTTTPLAKLHVSGTGIFDEPGAAIRVPATKGVLAAQDLGIWNSTVGGGGSTFAIAGWDTRKGIYLDTTSGNFGIDTMTPDTKLHVNGTLKLGTQGGSPGYDWSLSAGASGGDYGSVGYGYDYSNASGVHTYTANDFASRVHFDRGGVKFETAPAGGIGAQVPFTTAMSITQDGLVGIGTTTPITALDVNGNLRLGAALGLQRTIESPVRLIISSAENLYLKSTGGGQVFVQGSLSTDTLVLTSDRYKKTNIVELNSRDSLATLLKLPVYSWSFTNSPAEPHAGPMAQDWFKLTGLGPDDKHINPADMAGEAISAIKGLHELVQEKDSEIAALKAQNVLLQRQVAEVTKQVAGIQDVVAAIAKAMPKNGAQQASFRPEATRLLETANRR